MDENFSLGPWGQASQERIVEGEVDADVLEEDVTDEFTEEQLEDMAEGVRQIEVGETEPRRMVTYTRGPNGKLVASSS